MVLGNTLCQNRLFKGNLKSLLEGNSPFKTNCLHHQSVVYHRSSINNILTSQQWFDQSYSVLADYSLHSKLSSFFAQSIYSVFNAASLFCIFSDDGVSSKLSVANYRELYRIKANEQNHPFIFSILISFAAFSMKYCKKLLKLVYNITS